jgi:hypothetical protein
MTDPVATAAGESARKGLVARFLGILLSPRETFEDVVRNPRWLGMAVLILAVSVLCIGGFMATKVGQEAWINQAVTSTENWGAKVTEPQLQAMEKMAPYAWMIQAGSMLVLSPIFWLVLGGLLFGVFSTMGGTASFKQVFAVLVHSSVITCAQQLFIVPLNYARESLSSATNLAVLLPMLEEGTFLARLTGLIDLFIVWWLVVLSIGLSVLYKRRTGRIAAALFVVYGIIALVIAAVFRGRGGA